MKRLKLKYEKFCSTKGNEFLIRTNKRKVKLQDYQEISLSAKYYPMILRELIAKPAGLSVNDFTSFAELREVCEMAVKLSGVNER